MKKSKFTSIYVEEFICINKNSKLNDEANIDSDNNELTYSAMQKINAEFRKKWLE